MVNFMSSLTWKDLCRMREREHVETEVNSKDILKTGKYVERKKLLELWKSYLNHHKDPLISLYVHSAYCLYKKCSFCGYESRITNTLDVVDNYLDYLEEEINDFAPLFKNITFQTLYLGGGTSSIYNVKQLKRFYDLIFNNFKISLDGEMAQEFSFLTISEEKIKMALDHHFNKFTFGIQSFDREVLRLAKREYPNPKIIKKYVKMIQDAGAMVSCDLIWGLPGDTPEKLYDSIKKTIELGTNQIIIYHFHYTNYVKSHNLDTPEYLDYKEPYSEEEVVKVIEKLKSENLGVHFRLDNMTAIGIENEKNNVKWSKVPYITHPIMAERNSTLGLGVFARSFIENYFTYFAHEENKYYLTYYDSKRKYKLLYIIESLAYSSKNIDLYRRIDTEDYKKHFGTNFEEDFKDELKFVMSQGKIRKDGQYYYPVYDSENDLICIELAFFGDLLKKWIKPKNGRSK